MLISYQWDYIEYSAYDYIYCSVNYRAVAVDVPGLECFAGANTEKHINHSAAMNNNSHGSYSIRGPTYGAYTKHRFIT